MRNGCLRDDDQRRETAISKRKSISQLHVHAVREMEEKYRPCLGKRQNRSEDKMTEIEAREIDISNMTCTQYYRMGPLLQSRIIGFKTVYSND